MFAWYLSVAAHIFPYADLRSVCEGLTAAMCCLASVVRLARTQTVGLSVCRWWLAARLKAWAGAQGSLHTHGVKLHAFKMQPELRPHRALFHSVRLPHSFFVNMI